jgi:hypothetical protein
VIVAFAIFAAVTAVFAIFADVTELLANSFEVIELGVAATERKVHVFPL